MDHAALQVHEPQCGTVTTAGSVQIIDEENSLNIDTGNAEIDFVKTLHTILDRVSLDETDRQDSKLAISKFAAESTLAKLCKRSELISTRRSSQLFLR